jgi:hypothetical protein
MKRQTMEAAVVLAARGHGPISQLAAQCIHGQAISPSKLNSALLAAGYELSFRDTENGSAWAWAHKDGVMKAQGFAQSRDDALLHAVWGAIREEDAAKVVGDALAKKDIQVDEALRQTLETRYIVHGEKQFKKDLDVFLQLS